MSFLTPLAHAADDAPVVVELFTSQGCSSCPPADNFLHQWGSARFKEGKIIPLAYHVDYWDYIGWKDPFSSPAFTNRQRIYAQVLNQQSLYTPEIIVAGQVGFVGSDSSRAQTEVDRFTGRARQATISIAPTWKRDHLLMDITITPSEGAQSLNNKSAVFLAVFENNLKTQILRGENRGDNAMDSFVVRRLENLGTFASNATEPFKQAVDITWNTAWESHNTGIAVFLQSQKSFEIHSATRLFPISED